MHVPRFSGESDGDSAFPLREHLEGGQGRLQYGYLWQRPLARAWNGVFADLRAGVGIGSRVWGTSLLGAGGPGWTYVACRAAG